MKISEKLKIGIFAGVLALVGVGLALPNGNAWAEEVTATGKTESWCANKNGTWTEDGSTGRGTCVYEKTSGSGNGSFGEDCSGTDCIRTGADSTDLGDNSVDLTETVKNVINVILYVVGIIAVVMVIIGGVRYALSAGNQAAVTGAKNTIIYGIVGLVIAMLAYAIVNFVISRFE